MGSFRLATGNSASSRKIQFHWVSIGDSGEVIRPFMQDGTYPPRNFATLGPLWLQPPFTRGSISCFHMSFLLFSTGQILDLIHHIAILQSPVFLLNSCSPHLRDTLSNMLPTYLGPPFSEVTELICRVPSILFSQSP